jgi:ribosome-associated toxin RatA of RatAB toxin-antitoxin module
MRQIRRSALVAASPERMFELINDIERYPEFVPGCSAARVLERTPAMIHAELTVGSGLLKTTFATRNRLHPHHLIELHLESGALKSLNGSWTLTPLLAAGRIGCRVELDLSFEAKGGLAAMALGPVIEKLATSLVDAFVARARREADALAVLPEDLAS